MNKIIKDILSDDSKNVEEKQKELNCLLTEIKTAKERLENYKYCPLCDEFYLIKSFFTETESHEKDICVYQDPINSGGNEYAKGIETITYEFCPKGHKTEISRWENKCSNMR